MAEVSGMMAAMYKVLFVCTGNICRSPTAEGVFRHMVQAEGLHQHVDMASAGTHSYHIGEAPDPRTVKAAAGRGFDLSAQRARMVSRKDFVTFDLILAMDRGHYVHLEAMRPAGARAQLKLYLDYHPKLKASDVPDPYYGGPEGFSHVLDLVEQTSRALMDHVRKRVASRS